MRPYTKAIAAGNRYHAFMRGYKHGASCRPKDPKHMEHATLGNHYSAGYERARAHLALAADAASERYGYTPSPFREREETSP